MKRWGCGIPAEVHERLPRWYDPGAVKLTVRHAPEKRMKFLMQQV